MTRRFRLGLVLLALLAACRPGAPTASPVTPTATLPPPTATASPTPSPTPLPEGVVLLTTAAAPGVTTALQAVAEAHGLAFRAVDTLDGLDVVPRVVVTLDPQTSPPPQGLWIAWGAGEGDADHTVVQQTPDALRPAFLAGYLAAMITTDWRVGVVADNTDVIDAFRDGVRYFCGLCRPLYPPFYEYPRYVLLASEADAVASLQALANKGVQTVYLPFDLSTPAWQAALQAVPDLQIIGTTPPPDEALRTRWVATVTWDALTALTETLDAALRGDPLPATVTPDLVITEVNPRRLSPGRLANAEALIPDLLTGTLAP